MLQPEDVAEVALLCLTLPRRACVSELVLLPTDDRHVRAQAHAIAALVGRSPSPLNPGAPVQSGGDRGRLPIRLPDA
jgi:hypothetical protein